MIEHVDDFHDYGAIVAGENDPFGLAGETIKWRDKTYHTVQYEGDRPIGHVGLLVAPVHAGEETFDVVGVGGVIITRTHRGQGLLRALLEAALARDLGPERALLWCTRANAAIYSRLGFLELEVPVTVEQPAGPYAVTVPTMWRPLRAGVTWPAGDVRVPGLPF
jgi:GNAT superfamily N-acetyltransferase